MNVMNATSFTKVSAKLCRHWPKTMIKKLLSVDCSTNNGKTNKLKRANYRAKNNNSRATSASLFRLFLIFECFSSWKVNAYFTFGSDSCFPFEAHWPSFSLHFCIYFTQCVHMIIILSLLVI